MTDTEFKELIEKKLDGILSPVMPNSSYVSELQRRLTFKPEISIEYPKYLLTILTLSSGLVVGAVAIIVLNKIFKTMLKTSSQGE